MWFCIRFHKGIPIQLAGNEQGKGGSGRRGSCYPAIPYTFYIRYEPVSDHSFLVATCGAGSFFFMTTSPVLCISYKTNAGGSSLVALSWRDL